jgi:hypothetical protein
MRFTRLKLQKMFSLPLRRLHANSGSHVLLPCIYVNWICWIFIYSYGPLGTPVTGRHHLNNPIVYSIVVVLGSGRFLELLFLEPHRVLLGDIPLTCVIVYTVHTSWINLIDGTEVESEWDEFFALINVWSSQDQLSFSLNMHQFRRYRPQSNFCPIEDITGYNPFQVYKVIRPKLTAPEFVQVWCTRKTTSPFRHTFFMPFLPSCVFLGVGNHSSGLGNIKNPC